MPADRINADNQHLNTGADPYRAGYELRGWSSSDAGAATIGRASIDQADLMDDYDNLYYDTSLLHAISTADDLFSADGATLLMPACDLDLWAVWAADSNVKYTVELIKVTGEDEEVVVGTVVYTNGVTDMEAIADGNWQTANGASWTGEYIITSDDTPVTGYTYRHGGFDNSLVASDNTVLADRASIWKEKLTAGDEHVLKLYYQADLHTLKFFVGSGLWDNLLEPYNDTSQVREFVYFTEQETNVLPTDLDRAGYVFLGWSTDDDGKDAKGNSSRTIADRIAGTSITNAYNHIDPAAAPTVGYGHDYYDRSLVAGVDETDGTEQLFTASGQTLIMPTTDAYLYAVWYARDDVTYTVKHWRITGEGKLKEVVRETTLTGIADEAVTAVDRISGDRKKTQYDEAGKAYVEDSDFGGYTAVADGTTVVYVNNTTEPETNTQNVRTDSELNGDGSTVLVLFYEAEPLYLTFKTGSGAYAADDGKGTYNLDMTELVVYPVQAEARFRLNNYQIPTRSGYRFAGWTTKEYVDVVNRSVQFYTGVYGTVNGRFEASTAKARYAMAVLLQVQADGALKLPTTWFTMPTGDTTLYAVWEPLTNSLALYEGDGTDIGTDVEYQNYIRAYTDEEITLPDSSKVWRDGYELSGWYYSDTVELDSGDIVVVNEANGSNSIAAKTWIETNDWKNADGSLKCETDGCTHYSRMGYNNNIFIMPTDATILYAVWSAANDTKYTAVYYKVDGNGVLSEWVKVETQGITGDLVTIADPHTQPYAYNNQLVSTDWRGYDAKYSDAVEYTVNVSGNEPDATTLRVMAVGSSTTKQVRSNPTMTVQADGSTRVTLVMEAQKLKLAFDLGEGSWLDSAGNATSVQPTKYDGYLDPGVRAGIVSVVLPKANEMTRPGYTFKGWTVKGYNSPYGDTSLAATLKGEQSRQMAAWILANPTLDYDDVEIFNDADRAFVMPNHDLTLYAIWEANPDTTYQVVRYIITGNGERKVHDVVTSHTGTTDATALAQDGDETDAYSYTNTDNTEIAGYTYVPAGTQVQYYDSNNTLKYWLDENSNSVSSYVSGTIYGHSDWSTWTKTDGVYIAPEGEQVLTLYLYYVPKLTKLTLIMGDGYWLSDASESRIGYFPAFPANSTGSANYRTGYTVNLPIDQRYKDSDSIYGKVGIDRDADDRPYTLQGYAWDDGSTLTFVDQDGVTQTMTVADIIALGGGRHGMYNFDYRDALSAAGLWIPANESGSAYTLPETTDEEIKLYAIWALAVQPLTFDPLGYADINDPADTRIAKKKDDPDPDNKAEKAGSWVELLADGTVKTDLDNHDLPVASATAPTEFYDGKEHNIGQTVTLPRQELVTRVGYTLIGWSTTEGALTPDSGLSYASLSQDAKGNYLSTWLMPGEATTLYAVWAADEIELVYDVNGGDAESAPESTKGYVDCAVTVTEDEPTRPGGEFIGWVYYSASPLTNVDFEGGDTYVMFAPWAKVLDGVGNIGDASETENPNKLFALWKEKEYTITYVLTGITDSDGNDADDYVKTYKYSDTFISYTRPSQFDTETPQKGYQNLGQYISGWYSKARRGNLIEDGMTMDQVFDLVVSSDGVSAKVYPTWENITYDIQYDVSGGSNVSEEPENVIQGYYWTSAGIAPTNTKRTGYTLSGWYTKRRRGVHVYNDVSEIPDGETGYVTIADLLYDANNLGSCDDERKYDEDDPANSNPIILYALWDANEYEVYYSVPVGFHVDAESISQNFDATGIIQEVYCDDPSASSWTFSWYTLPGGPAGGGVLVTNDTELSQVLPDATPGSTMTLYAYGVSDDGTEVFGASFSLMAQSDSLQLEAISEPRAVFGNETVYESASDSGSIITNSASSQGASSEYVSGVSLATDTSAPCAQMPLSGSFDTSVSLSPVEAAPDDVMAVVSTTAESAFSPIDYVLYAITRESFFN